MENKHGQTDESVKAGLKIEGAHPDAATETAADINKELDADELVHERETDTTDSTNEKDMDELVHQQTKEIPNTDGEIDVDDLLHEPDNGEDQIQ